MITWVIGAGGLLGSAVTRHCGTRYIPGPVPWKDAPRARKVLHEQARGLEAAAQGSPWRIVWAAGAATTSTSQSEVDEELRALHSVISGLTSALPHGPGAFFLASSAGGMYAGASDPPFSTDTSPVPLSPYGHLKWAQEEIVTEALSPLIPVTIGRLSNLYGPGQNLDKLQGLISRLALAAVTRQPINVFVPLQTIRDYLYADDAARTVLDCIDEATMKVASPHVRIEIIASGQGTTVGQLIRTMDEIAKKRVPVALGTHASSVAQASDLRLRPSRATPWITPLPVGIKAVYDDILHRTQQEVLRQVL